MKHFGIAIILIAALILTACGPKAVTCDSFMDKFEELAMTASKKKPTPEQIKATKALFKKKRQGCKVDDLKADPEGVKCVLSAKSTADLLSPACARLSKRMAKW